MDLNPHMPDPDKERARIGKRRADRERRRAAQEKRVEQGGRNFKRKRQGR